MHLFFSIVASGLPKDVDTPVSCSFASLDAGREAITCAEVGLFQFNALQSRL
jgi:hypothetical protein